MDAAGMLALVTDVPADLLALLDKDAALTLLDAALADLDARVLSAKHVALGALSSAAIPIMDDSAYDLLQAARREVQDLNSTHLAVGRAFAVARARVGATDYPDLVAEYEARLNDAALFARLCVDKLVAAAGDAKATAHAFGLARDGASDWRGWANAAEGLARAAHNSATAALAALLGMRNEFAAEFFVAWRVIHALQRDERIKAARRAPVTLFRTATFVLSGPAADATPAQMVEAALADLARVLNAHNAAGEDLRGAASHLGLPRSDLWQRWCTRHAEVIAAGEEANRFLDLACTSVKDVATALDAAKGTRELVVSAKDNLRSARRCLAQLRNLATLEFMSCSWFVLKHLPG